MDCSIVISFAEEDMEYVADLQLRLNETLSRRYRWGDAVADGAEQKPYAWFYPDQPGGAKYHREISRRIAEAPAVIIILSEHSGESEWVIEEVEWMRNARKHMIVIALGDISVLQQTTVGRLLGNLVWIDPRHLPPRHDNEISAVIEALEAKASITLIWFGDKYVFQRQLVKRPYGGTYEVVREHDNAHFIAKEVMSSDREVLRELDERISQRRQLSLPSLPAIEDYIQQSERRFIVMEEIPGRSLNDQLVARDKAYTWNEIQPWAEQLLNILITLHSQEVTHLGIKPQNIKYVKGRLKLLDLGLDQRPHSAATIGTPDPYLAPEQLNDALADLRSDIYAVGATLYTLLSRDTQPNVTKPLAHTLNPNVPENVSLAIHKAMSVAMDSRFQIANDMLSALRDPQWRAAAGASQGSRHSVSPLMWGGGGVVALMVLALALWRLWPLSTPPTEGPGAGGVTAAPPQVATSAPEPTVAATVAVALAPTSAATTVPVPNALYGKTADDAVNQIKQEGIITIGVRLDAPPFGNDAKLRQQMKNTPNNTLCNASIDQPDFQPQGYDILIAREFAKRWLGDERKLKFRCVLVGERINAIRQGTVRIGALSFSALPERCNTTTGVACSIRYMLDGQGILVRKGADIQELCDIKGEKVGVVSNTSAEDLFAEGVKLFCGDPAPEIVPFSTRDDAIAQLLAGSISAYATNLEIIKELANEHPNDLTAVPGEYGEESFSIIVTPSETGLLELVNLTIQAMKKDGTLDALINTAFKSAVPPIDIDFNQNKTFPPYVLGTAPLVPTVTPQATSTTNSSYIVQKGETFSGIARKVYGNSQLWRCIAKANGIDDPKKLQPGPLKIPPKAGC